MKVLLSAYSCRPGYGSELGVGWRWAIGLVGLGHEVWLLTRTIFRKYIEQELTDQSSRHLHVVYYDPPPWISPKGKGIYAHYYMWQMGVFFVARQLCTAHRFDLVHHITLGVFRQPSFLYFLKTPFVFGPVGGGESAPYKLRKNYPIRGRMLDRLRDTANLLANWDPFLRILYARSSLILCKTEDTRNIIPPKYRHKVVIKREIGIDVKHVKDPNQLQLCQSNTALRVLYVGRLIYWKGLHLGLRALALLIKQYQDSQLTIIGTGKEEKWLKRRTQELGITDSVCWSEKFDHYRLLQKYTDFDLLLFPSLHDSSGNVVLEAMSVGLPVICLDLGGPATMVDDSCGCVVAARNASEEQVVEGLYKALMRFTEDPAELARCSDGARRKAESMSWHNTVADTYKLISSKVFGK